MSSTIKIHAWQSCNCTGYSKTLSLNLSLTINVGFCFPNKLMKPRHNIHSRLLAVKMTSSIEEVIRA